MWTRTTRLLAAAGITAALAAATMTACVPAENGKGATGPSTTTATTAEVATSPTAKAGAASSPEVVTTTSTMAPTGPPTVGGPNSPGSEQDDGATSDAYELVVVPQGEVAEVDAVELPVVVIVAGAGGRSTGDRASEADPKAGESVDEINRANIPWSAPIDDRRLVLVPKFVAVDSGVEDITGTLADRVEKARGDLISDERFESLSSIEQDAGGVSIVPILYGGADLRSVANDPRVHGGTDTNLIRNLDDLVPGEPNVGAVNELIDSYVRNAATVVDETRQRAGDSVPRPPTIHIEATLPNDGEVAAWSMMVDETLPPGIEPGDVFPDIQLTVDAYGEQGDVQRKLGTATILKLEAEHRVVLRSTSDEPDPGDAWETWLAVSTGGDLLMVSAKGPSTSRDGEDDLGGPTSRSRLPATPDESGLSSPVLPTVVVGALGLLVGAGAMFLLRSRQRPAPFGGPAFAAAGFPGGPVPGGFPGGVAGSAAPAGPVSYHPVPNPEPVRPVRPQPPPPGWTGAVHADRAVRLTDLGLNRLLPRDAKAGRSWAYEAVGVVAAAGWTEKKAGRGEDAEPTLRLHESGAALIGAYDGTGGAGAAVVRRLRDGTELTGAYVSSRLVRDLTEAWAVRRLGQGPLGDPADLRTALRGALRDEASVAPDTSGVRGSLSKKLPTTAAVLAVTPLPSGGVRAEVVWAGDSRAYALTANHGLQVLTVDDSRETDALELIRNDQPMTNVIAADADFTLHHRAIDRVGPALFLVATDGCFGYVSTPAHFEFHVLDTLLASADAGEWSARLVDRLGEIAADDVSFAVVAAGFDGFDAVKAAFRARHTYLEQEHWGIFQGAGEDPAERERLRIASWEVYRSGYEALVTDTGEPPR